MENVVPGFDLTPLLENFSAGAMAIFFIWYLIKRDRANEVLQKERDEKHDAQVERITADFSASTKALVDAVNGLNETIIRNTQRPQ